MYTNTFFSNQSLGSLVFILSIDIMQKNELSMFDAIMSQKVLSIWSSSLCPEVYYWCSFDPSLYMKRDAQLTEIASFLAQGECVFLMVTFSCELLALVLFSFGKYFLDFSSLENGNS